MMSYSALIIILVIILGFSIGSFLSAAVHRMAHKEAISHGRSKCTKCKATIGWYDLIPVFSYFMLRGKCRDCADRIAFFYVALELATGFLFGLAAWHWIYYGLAPDMTILIKDLLVVAVMIFLFTYDYKHYILPDKVTIPFIVIFFIFNLWLGVPLISLLIAVVVGGGFFLLQYLISKGKWIGGGDIRLGALMGAILGWPVILVALFLAYVFGAVAGLILIFAGKKKLGQKLPFGTFLTVATIICLFWGTEILNWYVAML